MQHLTSFVNYGTFLPESLSDKKIPNMLIQKAFMVGFWLWLMDEHPNWTIRLDKQAQELIEDREAIISDVRGTSNIIGQTWRKMTANNRLDASIDFTPFNIDNGSKEYPYKKLTGDVSHVSPLRGYIRENLNCIYMLKCRFNITNRPMVLRPANKVQNVRFFNFDVRAQYKTDNDFFVDEVKLSASGSPNGDRLEILDSSLKPESKYLFDTSIFIGILDKFKLHLQKAILQLIRSAVNDPTVWTKDDLRKEMINPDEFLTNLLEYTKQKNPEYIKELFNSLSLSPWLVNAIKHQCPGIHNFLKELREPEHRWKTDLTADMGDLGFPD